MDTIILASKSPRRKEILEMAGIPYVVITADTDESGAHHLPPEDLVKELAKRKLSDVRRLCPEDHRLILAADTVVAHRGVVFGKPKNEEDAARMLAALSGSVHTVYTGIAMEQGGLLVSDVAATDVYMRKLTPHEIDAYIKTGEPMDKAGAYGIQEKGGIFVRQITGDFYNVVGLPLHLVCLHLFRDFGISVL